MRKFGDVWLAGGRDEVESLLARLGPDALAVGRAGFLRLLETRRGRIKAVLLDQSFIAGVGNFLADEALWRARIHPARRIEDLPIDDRVALFRELRSVIRRQTVDSYPEGFRSRWTDARGRDGARCPRCGTELARTVVGGRTTYLCPSCQPPA
jgi:formamidopyrimidine-DNA glycosylase